MKFSEHCNLCDNPRTDLQDGIICGLTDKKPSFNKTCSKILFNKKFENKIGLVHIKIEQLKKKKVSIYIYFFLCMAIGCILIISQRNLLDGFDFTYSKYVKLARSLLVVFLGLVLSGFAYRKLNHYRGKSKIVKDEKDRIDAILDKYQIKYSCSVKFGEKYHENQDVIVELKSNLLKDSKITYQI